MTGMTSFRANPSSDTPRHLRRRSRRGGESPAVRCNAARADDDTDGDEPTLTDTAIIQYVLKGLGLAARRRRTGINYRERSPLVAAERPGRCRRPKRPTRPPRPPAGRIDPDIKRAKKKKDDERKRRPYTEGVDDRPLLPSEYSGSASGKGDNPTILGGEKRRRIRRISQHAVGARLQEHLQQGLGQQAGRAGDLHRRAAPRKPRSSRPPAISRRHRAAPYGIGKDAMDAAAGKDRPEHGYLVR